MSLPHLRSVIVWKLQELAEELAKYGMTTHGLLADGSIENVADALVELWNDNHSDSRGSYLISDLYQLINKLKDDLR